MNSYIKKSLSLFFAVICLSCLSLPSVTYAQNNQKLEEPQHLASVKSSLKNFQLDIMLARTNAEKAKGLMFYKDLPENSGMLFVYNEPQIMSFWMRNTRIPLDLVFFSENLTVTEWIKSMKPGYGKNPYTLPHYTSKHLAKYALELKAGMIDKLDLKIGDKLEIPLILLYSE